MTTTTPWTKQTRDQLKEQARGYGLDTSGTREDIYKRILNHLRDAKRAELGVEPVAAVEEEEEDDFDDLAGIDDDEDDDDVAPDTGKVDLAMEVWRSGEDLVEPESTLPGSSRWAQMEAMAKVLVRSKLVPAHIRNSADPEADCIVILLTAHDLGLSATLALRKVHVIEGQPALAAELMRLLIMRDGHDIDVKIESDANGRATAAELLIHRKEWRDEDWRGARFSLDDAKDAGLTGRGPWKSYAEDMLVARATSRAARRYCPDSLGGVSYTPEELGAIDVDEVYDETPAPGPRELTDEERETITNGIAALEDSQRDWMRAEWKARGIPLFTPVIGRRNVTDQHLPFIHELLREANAQPTDAEVVDEPITGIMTGGQRTYDSVVTPDVSIVRADTRVHKEEVGTLAERLEATDAALDDSKEARASKARAIMEAARVKAESGGLVEPKPEGAALCPDCKKPMSEDNPKCMSHPL